MWDSFTDLLTSGADYVPFLGKHFSTATVTHANVSGSDSLDTTEARDYTPSSTAGSTSMWRGCGEYVWGAVEKTKNLFKASGTVVYRTTLLAANIISLPFAKFLWVSMFLSYKLIYDEYLKDDYPSWPLYLLYAITAFRVACSTIMDITSSDLANLDIGGAKLSRYHWYHPRKLFYRAIQLMFLFTALIYSMSYLTGFIYLIDSPLWAQILETIPLEGLGALYYFLFTNPDIENVSINITEMGKAIKKAFSSGVEFSRFTIFLESTIATAFYRCILAGNDWLVGVEAVKYLQPLSDAITRKVYIATLAIVMPATLATRTASIYHTYCPRALTPEEQQEKNKFRLCSGKLISTIVRIILQSGGLGYLLWGTNHPAAIAASALYCAFELLVTVDLMRDHEAIRIIGQGTLPTTAATPLLKDRRAINNSEGSGNEAQYNHLVSQLDRNGSKLHTAAKIVTITGRMTRLDALLAFIHNNNRALHEFNIVTLLLQIDTTLALTVYLGMLNVGADTIWYLVKMISRASNRMISWEVIKDQYSSKCERLTQFFLTDWRRKGEFSSDSLTKATAALTMPAA
jgi:hypothetical protein